MTTHQISIIGTGLIGSSIGLGLTAAGWDVVGWDVDPDRLHAAADRGALRPAARSKALAGPLIVLAAPVSAIIDMLAELRTDGLVTDVAGVKQSVANAAAHLPRFVGGHPMAGRESSGPDGASGALFTGAAWVVTPDGASSEDVATVDSMARALGARPVHMSAAEHDTAVAAISHLPQLLAAALIEIAVDTPAALDLAAGSFRDLTRVAQSEASGVAQVVHANAGALRPIVEQLRGRLGSLAGLLDDSPGMQSALENAGLVRRSIAPPVVAVAVVLADQPGELAKVGRALGSSAVDIRDLQLRHGRHGGGGVLTLSVRPGEADVLSSALRAEGLQLAD
ncbi:MAG: prephenate dehydrogenase/arogenate dehydrogenase family protein [Acidimicrobiia bacterium]|nr:prephenate dehydrogenase/arogenate dehydrogenase family protein [Acidimicrobiia bacterium]